MNETKENSSNSSSLAGNTKQPVPSKNWTFTYNNYPNNWEEILSSNSSKILEFVYGKEIGKSGTPHIQGYIKLKNKGRPSELKWPQQIHWEKVRDVPKCIKYCMKDGDYITNIEIEAPLKLPLEGKKLYPWQEFVLKLTETKPDDRTIYWFYEEVGNTGKSSLCKQICIENKNAMIISGKGADIKYAIAESKIKPKIILVDIPRTRKEYVSYESIEEIKNGCFYSGKYEGKMVLMNSPLIICFSNFVPETCKMSRDRFKIYEITGNYNVIEVTVDDIEGSLEDCGE